MDKQIAGICWAKSKNYDTGELRTNAAEQEAKQKKGASRRRVYFGH